MKLYRWIFGLFLCTALLVACDNSNDFDEYAHYSNKAQTTWGQNMVNGSNGYIAHVKSDKTVQLAEGVEMLQMGFLTSDGLSMEMFLFKIKLSDKITMRATLANDLDAVGTGQSIMDQLGAMVKNGKKVVGGTNADFFNTSTYIPYGVCYRNGVCVKSAFGRVDCNVFAIYKSNTAHCLTADEYTSVKDSIREAVCGRSTFLLAKGQQLDQSTNTMTATNLEPRTSIGISQDGKEVYLMVVDGRNFYYSNGADLYDLMNLMSASGSYDAVNLDGGGSSTFIARNPNSSELELLNWPSDNGGVIRAVATGLAIVEQ